MKKAKILAAALLLITMVACGRQIEPVDVVNGNFETGDLTGWSTEAQGMGKWLVYEDGSTPPEPSISDPNFPFDVPAPPEGNYAAVTDMNNAGMRILYQDVELNSQYLLHFTVFYENRGDGFHILDTFNYLGEPNQQFRVDLMAPSAEVDSLKEEDVLANIFRTSVEDSPILAPTPISFDLSPWSGQVVRLRFTGVDNSGPLRAGLDDVRLELFED